MTESTSQLPVREAGWTPARTEQNLAKFHGARVARSQRRRRLGYGALVLACAVAVFLAVGMLKTTGNVVQNQARLVPASGTSLPPLVNEHAQVDGVKLVRFRDGSTAELLVSGSQLLVDEVSEGSVRVNLTAGSGRFQIVPHPERRFVVLARGVGITVLGTEFTVDHESQRVRVAVARGKVEVSSRLGKRILTAGEASWFPTEGEGASPSASVEKGGQDGAQERSKVGADGAAAALPKSVRERLVEHHRRAEYKEAYALMTQSGAAVGTSDDDLMRAADAARYSGHPAEALRYLKRIGPSGEHATSAAFTRGRLLLYELGNPAEAAEAFATARRLSPAGALAEDALYREIEARYRAGQSAAVATLAQKFLKAYPESRRREAVAKIGSGP